jgi:hypothetical protein
MRIICCVLFFVLSSANALECPAFSENQLKVLNKAFEYGVEFDLSHTLAVIALSESSAGVKLVNDKSRDYGVFQANRHYLCIQEGADTEGSCNSAVLNVVVDMEFAAKHALITLKYWRNYHKNSFDWYNLMIRSYNEGFSYNGPAADIYIALFRKNMKIINDCTTVFV